MTGQRSGKLTKATDSTLGMSSGGGGGFGGVGVAIVAGRRGVCAAMPDESAGRLNWKPGGASGFGECDCL